MSKTLLFFVLFPALTFSQEIKGTYPNFYETSSTKTKLELWESVIDFFAKNNFTVKSLDKENGIATAISSDLMPKYSYEKKGIIKDNSALVVLEDIGGLNPVNIHLTINIRISEGKIMCSTSAVEVKSDKPRKAKWRYYYGAKSTGVYEKLIAESVK